MPHSCWTGISESSGLPPAFYRLFQTLPEKTEGRLFYEIGDGEWDTPDLRSLLEEVLPKNSRVQDFEIWQKVPNIGRRKLLLNAARTTELVENEYFIIVSIEDVIRHSERTA